MRYKLTVVLLFAVVVPALAQTPGSLAKHSALYTRLLQRESEQKAAVAQSGLPARIHIGQHSFADLIGMQDGLPLYVYPLNTGAAEDVNAVGLASGTGGSVLTGAGQIVGMWESGRSKVEHPDFGGRVIQKDAASFNNEHATAVTGTLASSGVTQPLARGMAPEAIVWAYDWGADLVEMMQAAAAGMQVSNHSYGVISGWGPKPVFGDDRLGWYGNVSYSDTEDYKFGLYNGLAQAWDDIAHANPYLQIVKAAGNDRSSGPEPGTEHYVLVDGNWTLSTAPREVDGGGDGFDSLIGDASVAKNVLVVGSSHKIDGPYTGPGSVNLSSFSAFGPTDDGRIKPDLVAPGEILKTNSNGGVWYGQLRGTSGSAPVVTGSIALLLEEQRNLWGPNIRLTAASIRALLLHTARESGPAAGPDYSHGFGFLDIGAATELLAEDYDVGGGNNVRQAVLTSATAPETSFDFVATGQSPIKLTIAWTDPSGTPPPAGLDPGNLMLVNDLDVRITGPLPGGSTHMPWVLNPANPGAPATKGDNFRDNVEQIYIPNPEAGLYVVTVSHKGTLQGGSQPYSLALTGSSNISLPVELVAFSGRSVDEDKVLLKWSTATEQNNAGFEVEHRRDGTLFRSLGHVEGAGTTRRTTSYSFTAAGLEPGVHIFRLRQMDQDGSFDFSQEIEVEIDIPNGIFLSDVYPNPFNPTARFSFAVSESQWVNIVLFDALGREARVLFDGIVPGGTSRSLVLDAGGLPTGRYFLQLRSKKSVDTRQVTLLR